MTKENEDLLVQKALKSIAEEDLELFIDSKNVPDLELKKALLSKADINILIDDYHIKTKEDA